jgi:DNA-binding PadR family transcriptional regulator
LKAIVGDVEVDQTGWRFGSPLRRLMKSERTRLTELEHVVLGIVWKDGPCTAHAIRMHTITTRNSRFSGSPGAIYPVMRRLEFRGLVSCDLDCSGRQLRRTYTTTYDGRAALRSWLKAACPVQRSDVLQDPVRLRIYFLEALPMFRRRTVLEAMEQGLGEQMEDLVDDLGDDADRGETYRLLATRGAITVCRAQRRWIQGVRESIEDSR